MLNLHVWKKMFGYMSRKNSLIGVVDIVTYKATLV